MTNNNSITWKQVGVILSLIALLALGGAYTNTKADKVELEKTELRLNIKITELQVTIQDDIREIKDSILRLNDKQDRMYDLLVGGKVVPK